MIVKRCCFRHCFFMPQIFTFLKISFACLVLIIIPFGYFGLSTFGTGSDSTLELIKQLNIKTAIVPGAQVIGHIPSNILKKRLDQAGKLFSLGVITNILVSGDNSDQYYNEPLAMKIYLSEYLKVPEANIYTDYGGRRTLDTCWRARNVFNISKAVIITQAFHLSRATYLCRNVGIDVVPVIADNAGLYSTINGTGREVFASWNAIYDIFNNKKALIKPDGKEPDLGDN